jgi:uncharacterized protein YndB with AHSA1/START domain
MNESSVAHDTFVIERNYPAAPQRVFAAFADPKRKRQWFAEGEKSEVEAFEMDFRVGGWERTRFRFQGDLVCTNDSVYLDIQPERRIVIAYTMTIGDRRISSSQMTVELLPKGSGTRLVFTEQGAYFEGADGPAIRKEGWSLLLDQLGQTLE